MGKGIRMMKNGVRAVVLAALFALCASQAPAAPPICPHICYWTGAIASWAQGAPWIKVLSALDCQGGHDMGCKVFYRPYDIPGHDDGGTGDGTGMADAVLARLATIPPAAWPEAVGYRNEFGGSDTTTTAQFINYRNRLRAGGYSGWIVFGSYSTGVPESYRWSQSDVKNAVNLADAIETHEYFDLTVAHCYSWLMCRHVRFINENPYLQGKPWFIGEAGSDRISNSSCHEDSCDRRGWRYVGCGAQKLTDTQYINELTSYRSQCSSQVVAVFLFQQGDGNWADFDVMGTSVATWMQSTWPAVTTGTIAGNVKSSAGQNLSGAVISTSTGGYSATTDSSGNYTIPGVAPGVYNISASKSGYNQSTQTGRTVTANQTTTVNFTLTPVPPGTLVGTVRSASGEALPSATVTLTPGGAWATTDASGGYSIGNLSPGVYTATATKQGYMDASASVTIQSGSTTTHDFSLYDLGTELLTNGSFDSGCTGWSKSQSPSGIYWGCGNKAYPDGTVIMLTDKAVTASNGSAFWIEEDDRSSGIRVSAANSLAPGTRAAYVSGVLATANGERVISQAQFATQ